MAGRNKEKIENAAGKLSQYSDQIHTVIVDVSIQEQVENAIENTAEEAGRLDFLFNNAGIGGAIKFEDTTLNEWKNFMDVNVLSVIYGTNVAVPIMLKQKFGHIVNTASLAGLIPAPFHSIYTLTKYAITGLTESLRYEYAEKGIHFSTVCPSFVSTPILKKSIDGTVVDEAKIPDNAIPVGQAVKQILNELPEQKGIIVVPEKLRESWQTYVFEKLDEFLLQMAHERRESLEKHE